MMSTILAIAALTSLTEPAEQQRRSLSSQAAEPATTGRADALETLTPERESGG